jgi:hypothetical protein
MNSRCYPENPHLDIAIDWSVVEDIYFDPKSFLAMLESLGGEIHVLARDWENKASKDELSDLEEGLRDIKGLTDMDVTFSLPSEGDWTEAEVVELEDISQGCWEVDANTQDPFLYWWPSEYGEHWATLTSEQKKWSRKWKSFINEFNENFKKWSAKHGGVYKLLDDIDAIEELKILMPGLLSCVPWHFLAKQVWEPSPDFSKEAWEKLVAPARKRLKELLA